MSEQDEDFATMFEASVKARRFERGQLIEGTVVAFGPDVAFVSVGGKSEAQIDLAELKDADGHIEVKVGDRIHAVVVSTSGGVTLSRKGVRNVASQRELENAFEAGLAVEGKVEGANKGGYEVRIARERAFCPLSQIDIARTADPAVHGSPLVSFPLIKREAAAATRWQVKGRPSRTRARAGLPSTWWRRTTFTASRTPTI